MGLRGVKRSVSLSMSCRSVCRSFSALLALPLGHLWQPFLPFGICAPSLIDGRGSSVCDHQLFVCADPASGTYFLQLAQGNGRKSNLPQYSSSQCLPMFSTSPFDMLLERLGWDW